MGVHESYVAVRGEISQRAEDIPRQRVFQIVSVKIACS